MRLVSDTVRLSGDGSGYDTEYVLENSYEDLSEPLTYVPEQGLGAFPNGDGWTGLWRYEESPA